MLTGAMKDRKKKLDMIYNHDDMNNGRLTDKVKKADVSGEAGKWIIKQVNQRRPTEGSDLL